MAKDKQNAENRTLSKAEQLKLRREGRGNGEVADWSKCDSGNLLRAIVSAGRNGFAITFGYTRDFGAYTVRVLGDDSFETEYIRPTESIDLFLTALADDLEAIW